MGADVLFLTGTVGAGKTTTAEAIGELWQYQGIPHAVIDLDWLRRYWPNPPGDRFGITHELPNLRCVAGTYLTAGAQRLVIAGVVGDAATLQQYAEVLEPGSDRVSRVVVCRLRVATELGLARIARRHDLHEADRIWHTSRFGELDAILDDAAVEDVTVDVGERTPPEVARAVLDAIGW